MMSEQVTDCTINPTLCLSNDETGKSQWVAMTLTMQNLSPDYLQGIQQVLSRPFEVLVVERRDRVTTVFLRLRDLFWG